MENLFYCPKESILFWITFTDGEHNVVKLTEDLNRRLWLFIGVAGCSDCDVNTEVVLAPTAYWGCRVYSCKTERVPTNAYVIGDDWTVTQWLNH